MATLILKSKDSVVEVEAKRVPMWHHSAGLQFTASGYGRRIPTDRMVRVNGRWRRVYCCIYSNAGTCYIGDMSQGNIITD